MGPGRPAAPTEFTLPPGSSAAAVIEDLGAGIEPVPGGPAISHRRLLDTVDGRLHGGGLLLEEHEADADGGSRLVLTDRGRAAGAVGVERSRQDRLLATELPAGRLRDRLVAVTAGRALLSRAELRTRGRSFRALNRDGKTVLRITVEEPVVAAGPSRQAALAIRIRLHPVRGYDGAYRRAAARLARAGCSASGPTMFEEAVGAAGGTPEGLSARVDVRLEPEGRLDRAVAAVSGRLIEVVEGQLGGARADLDPEFLHDLRVGVRRARSLLREFGAALPEAERRQVAAALRWIQQVTGPVRDLDVHLEEWPALLAGLPPVAVANLAPVHDVLVRRRGRAFDEMRQALGGDRFERAMAGWRALTTTAGAAAVAPGHAADDDGPAGASRPVAVAAGERVRALYGRMVKEGGRIDDTSPAEALHDLRKRGKELRYVLEHFGSLWPDASARLVRPLKDLQDVLGRFQDRQVQAAHLRQLAPEVATELGGATALLALSPVIDELERDAARARREFAQRFATFASRPTRRLVASAFGPGLR